MWAHWDCAQHKIKNVSVIAQGRYKYSKNICSYVSHKNGGMGAVRDVIEQVMKIQNNWAK